MPTARTRHAPAVRSYDGGNVFIRDGIVIVPQAAVVHDGTVI